MNRLAPLSTAEQALLRQVLGERCRRARELLGLSQRRLALAMDRSESWVREIERGKQYAPAYLISVLADALGKPVGWFYGQQTQDVDQVARDLLEGMQRALGVVETTREPG